MSMSGDKYIKSLHKYREAIVKKDKLGEESLDKYISKVQRKILSKVKGRKILV